MTRHATRPMSGRATIIANDRFYIRHPEFVVNGRRLPLSVCARRDGRARREWLDLYEAAGGQVEEGDNRRCEPAPSDSPPDQCADNQGRLSIRVTNEAGAPVPEAYVEIEAEIIISVDQRGQIVGGGYTDSNGRVEFNVFPGNYVVHVDAPDSVPWTSARVTVAACAQFVVTAEVQTAKDRVRLVSRIHFWHHRIHDTSQAGGGDPIQSGQLGVMIGNLIKDLIVDRAQGEVTRQLVPEDYVITRVDRKALLSSTRGILGTSDWRHYHLTYTWGPWTPEIIYHVFNSESYDTPVRDWRDEEEYTRRIPRDEIWDHIRDPESLTVGTRTFLLTAGSEARRRFNQRARDVSRDLQRHPLR